IEGHRRFRSRIFQDILAVALGDLAGERSGIGLITGLRRRLRRLLPWRRIRRTRVLCEEQGSERKRGDKQERNERSHTSTFHKPPQCCERLDNEMGASQGPVEMELIPRVESGWR